MLSGDSTVKSFSYDGEIVEFIYEDYDSEKNYKIRITTPSIFSEVKGGQSCVHVRMEDSLGKLDIDEKSGRFYLPSTFPQQMALIKKGYHVLAGLKATEYKKVFLLIGYSKILLCPIKDETCVSINII